MIKFSKTGVAAILVMAAMTGPASADEQATSKADEPVRTASVAPATMEISHRSTTADDPVQQPGDSNGWGMLAAGLCVGLLIIARRRHG